MSKEINRDIKLGFFVFLGIVVFVIGIFFIGSKENMFIKSFRVSVLFKNATGLKSGDYVRYNGVKVGVVENVLIQNDSVVKVDMQIDEPKRPFIRKNSVANIASDGLMGNKIVNIVPGTGISSIVQDNDYIRGNNPLIMENVMQTLNTTNENVKVISDNLKNLTTELNQSNGTLQTLIRDTTASANLLSSLTHLKSFTTELSSSGETLQHIINDISNGKNSLGEMLKDTSIASNLDASMKQIKSASDKLATVSSQLSGTVNMINSGNGTVTHLLSDTAMVNNINRSIINIKQASNAFNQDMEALKHSIFLRGYFKKQEKKEEQQN